MFYITAPTLGGGWTGSIKVRATLIEVFSTEICLSFIFIINLNVKNRAVGVKKLSRCGKQFSHWVYTFSHWGRCL